MTATGTGCHLNRVMFVSIVELRFGRGGASSHAENNGKSFPSEKNRPQCPERGNELSMFKSLIKKYQT